MPCRVDGSFPSCPVSHHSNSASELEVPDYYCKASSAGSEYGVCTRAAIQGEACDANVLASCATVAKCVDAYDAACMSNNYERPLSCSALTNKCEYATKNGSFCAPDKQVCAPDPSSYVGGNAKRFCLQSELYQSSLCGEAECGSNGICSVNVRLNLFLFFFVCFLTIFNLKKLGYGQECDVYSQTSQCIAGLSCVKENHYDEYPIGTCSPSIGARLSPRPMFQRKSTGSSCTRTTECLHGLYCALVPFANASAQRTCEVWDLSVSHCTHHSATHGQCVCSNEHAPRGLYYEGYLHSLPALKVCDLREEAQRPLQEIWESHCRFTASRFLPAFGDAPQPRPTSAQEFVDIVQRLGLQAALQFYAKHEFKLSTAFSDFFFSHDFVFDYDDDASQHDAVIEHEHFLCFEALAQNWLCPRQHDGGAMRCAETALKQVFTPIAQDYIGRVDWFEQSGQDYNIATPVDQE